MVQLKFGLKRKSCLTVTSLILLCVIAIWLFHSYSSSFWNQLSPFAVGESDPVVIVILGGGVTAEGRVPEHTQERVKVALCVYHQEVMGNGLFITLSGGTPHKPNPLDEKGFPVWEATAAARALLEAGVPPERILEESFSLDTVGNAYFLRCVHMDPSQLRRMVVVTNDWHMPRTRAIFEHVFSLPAVRGGPVPSYELEFRAAAPGIPDTRLLQLRQEKESTSLQYFLAEVAPVLGSLQEMHRWVFVQHAAYAASRLQERKEGVEGLSAVSAELLKTY